VQQYPKGYPLQAAFQSSDSSWSIYRAFNYLHSRVILDLQEEIRGLEDALEEMDLDDQGSSRITSRKDDLEAAQPDVTSPRVLLIETIRQKLINYGILHLLCYVFKYLLIASQMNCWSKHGSSMLSNGHRTATIKVSAPGSGT
jgi:hypothetical protein